jgi:hypothetical protein
VAFPTDSPFQDGAKSIKYIFRGEPVKILMFYAHEWWYRTASKSLHEAPEVEAEESVAGAAVVFFHSEAEDEDRRPGVIQKFVKNTKWIAGKFGTKNVVLHSFNHLSLSKSSPEFARSISEEAAERLERAGYRVMRTPFGYFNEFRMHVAGDSLAKVYKEF